MRMKDGVYERQVDSFSNVISDCKFCSTRKQNLMQKRIATYFHIFLIPTSSLSSLHQFLIFGIIFSDLVDYTISLLFYVFSCEKNTCCGKIDQIPFLLKHIFIFVEISEKGAGFFIFSQQVLIGYFRLGQVSQG